MRVPFLPYVGLGFMLLGCHMASAAEARQTDLEARPAADPALSQGAMRVSQIATQLGDRRFILVDKAHGEIMLFQNGKPTFRRPALTGESLADHLPSDAIYKPVSQHVGVKYKVTPAGRFTLARGHDTTMGDTMDINELQGSDWIIAIHKVWLGIRSQRRDERLLSANDKDKHITEGCVDVEAGTMAQLFRLLPKVEGTAIYIVPIDETLIDGLFQPRTARNRTPSPTG
jgi:hypothetical protein